MAHYELSAVARLPVSGGPPTLTEIEGISAPQITWIDDLAGPGSVSFSCDVNRLPAAVAARLRDLAANPTEVWLTRDSVRVAAGIVEGYQVQGGTVSVTAPGLLHYLAYMQVEADLVYASTDQFDIASGLVDQWQALPFGNYGIDTSGIALSGVTRAHSYLAVERHQVLQRLLELAAVDNGFDVHVDAATRALVLDYPTRGADLSGSVVFDARNITDAGIAVSVAPGDLASDAYGQGTSSASAPLTSHQFDAGVRTAWGRAAVASNFDGVSVQATLDGHTRKLLADRLSALFLPGPGLIPVADADVNTFGPGDVVAYSFDAGLGRQDVTGRVARKQVTVDAAGNERLAIGLRAVPVGDDPWTVLASAVGKLAADVDDLRTTALARA